MKTISALLVVNDSELCRQIGRVLEKNSRLRFEFCSSAKKALEILHARTFQILYSELNLDDMTGVDLTQRVKRQFPAIDVLIGSPAGTAKDVICAMQAGASDFIIDPFEAELIEAAFEKSHHPGQSASRPAGDGQKSRPQYGNRFWSPVKAERARNCWPHSSMPTATVNVSPMWPSIARRCRNNWLKVNCSGMKKGLLPAPLSRKIGKFESAGKEHWFWMKSLKWHCRFKPNCCAPCRNGKS
jgi:CheY-like chemotaxis protein